MYDTLEIIKQVILLGNLRKKISQKKFTCLPYIWTHSIFLVPVFLILGNKLDDALMENPIGRVSSSSGIIWLPREGVDNGRKGSCYTIFFC